MNIFVTSKSPHACAQYLDNKRLIKMCLETSQMLSTAICVHVHGNNRNIELKRIATILGIYKPTHVNHPCNVWCRETRGNYYWLLNHFKCLCDEYTKRYDKVHKSFLLYDRLLHGAKSIPCGKRTPFVNCAANSSLGISFKHVKNTMLAYRMYLGSRWSRDKKQPKWGKKCIN